MADYLNLRKEILDDIKQNKSVATSQQRINSQLKNGTADYKSAADFSKTLGSAVGSSFKKNVTDVPSEELGQFAKEVVAPVYSQEQKTMLSVCSKVQKQINKDAGLEINPVEVKQDVSRIQHIVGRFEEASSFDEVSFLLNENTAQSIARGAVNDSMGDNIDFQEDSGLSTLIVRSDNANCCDFCASVCGEFHSKYDLPDYFWSIHRNCTCVIDYRVKKTNQKIKYKTNKDGSLGKSIEKNIYNDTIKLPDEVFHRSVGAKFNTYEVWDPYSDEYFYFAENTRLQNNEVFAGKDTNSSLDDAVIYGLSEVYKVSNPEEWQHGKSKGYLDYYGEPRKAEVHWFMHPECGKVSFKVKKWLE